MGVGDQRYTSAALSPGKDPVPVIKQYAKSVKPSEVLLTSVRKA